MSTVEDKDTVAMAVDKPTAEELTEKSKQNSITVQGIVSTRIVLSLPLTEHFLTVDI